MRCPECNRTLQGEECSIHGSVKGVEDLRIKLVVDDGTGVVSGILDKASTEKLLGKTYDELKKMSETEGTESIVEEMNTLLFAHRISLRGNALGDAFGITILAKDAALADIDMDAKSEKISKELEEIS